MNTKLLLTAAAALSCPVLHAQTAPSVTAAPVSPAVPTSPTTPAAPASPAAAPVTLRYKFAVGQVRRYSYSMSSQGQMPTGQTGGAMPMNETMQMIIRQVVKSVRPSDGAATFSSRIESLHLLTNGSELPLPAAVKAKMTQPFTQVMLPTGKVLSLSMPGMASAGASGMDFSKSLKNMFSDLVFLPEGPVKVGDQWNGVVDAAGAAAVGAAVSYTATLTGIDQKNGATLAMIENKKTGTIDKSLSQGMPATMHMSGTVTGTGTQVFDTTAGTPQSAAGTTSVDMTMTFAKAADGTLPPGVPSAMKMNMQMKYTMTRLSDIPPTAIAPVQ